MKRFDEVPFSPWGDKNNIEKNTSDPLNSAEAKKAEIIAEEIKKAKEALALTNTTGDELNKLEWWVHDGDLRRKLYDANNAPDWIAYSPPHPENMDDGALTQDPHTGKFNAANNVKLLVEEWPKLLKRMSLWW